jgi:hypothetical protein
VILLWAGWRLEFRSGSQTWQWKTPERLAFEVEYVDEHGQLSSRPPATLACRHILITAPPGPPGRRPAPLAQQR